MVDLCFRLSDNYVQTYYLSREEFETLLVKSREREGYVQPHLFALKKRDYFRWSFESHGMTHQVRVENGKWEALESQYREKMASSQDVIVTCIVP